MTQTNTDYLLQITPAVDRTYGATGVSDDAGVFGDHLSQAATLSGYDSHNLNNGSQQTDTACKACDDRPWSTDDFQPISQDGGNTATSQTSPPDQEESTDKVSGSKPAIEDADSDEHDSKKADDASAAEIAGAGQAAKD